MARLKQVCAVSTVGSFSFSLAVANCPTIAWTLHSEPPTRPSGVHEFLAPKAGRVMVIDEACGLHEGVAGGGSDESESPLLELFAHRRSDGRRCRQRSVVWPFAKQRP